MKLLKAVTFSIVVLFVLMSFSQCSSSKMLQEKAPVNFGAVYFQSWVAGVQGGGSGINIFIPINEMALGSFELDSVYFRGKSAKLETKTDKTLYIGRFSTPANQQKDIKMTNDPNGEYGNAATGLTENFPFQLKDDECVVSYKDNSQTKYYKIENISEKARVEYPSAPPNRGEQED
jgi:hypothetical protein